MPITLDGTNGITTPTYGGADTSEYLVPVTQFKNRIINGAMVIDQRNAGASVTPSSYTLDRWTVNQWASSGKFSVQQNAGSVTPPAGFRNYLGATSLSAYSVASGDFYAILQPIEGFNTADLMWGTANAQTVTLSFWVRSSLTGTFGGAIQNSATNRSYPYSYTISSANTWEYKTVTIAGDTSGTWVGATNGIGMYVAFSLGAGSTYQGTAGAWAGADYRSATGATSVVGTNGATFYITGVQLEVGSTATSFDYRPYGTELQLCQRYYFRRPSTDDSYAVIGTGHMEDSTSVRGAYFFPVPMRAKPTCTLSGTVRIYTTSASNFSSNGLTASTPSTALFFCTTSSSLTAGHAGVISSSNNTTSYVDGSAEL